MKRCLETLDTKTFTTSNADKIPWLEVMNWQLILGRAKKSTVPFITRAWKNHEKLNYLDCYFGDKIPHNSTKYHINGWTFTARNAKQFHFAPWRFFLILTIPEMNSPPHHEGGWAHTKKQSWKMCIRQSARRLAIARSASLVSPRRRLTWIRLGGAIMTSFWGWGPSFPN